MEPKGASSALQRKMAASGSGTPGGSRSILRALRLALARAADEIFDLPLTVIGATQARSGLDGLDRHLDDDCLQILLDGPDRRIGVVRMDRDCLAALIQQQTIGKVTAGQPAERAFTSTDAALTAPLIDAMIDRGTSLVDLPADRHCLEGYRFGARAEDRRSLLLALDAERFRLFELKLEFDGGVRQGTIALILPEPPDPPAEIDPAEGGADRPSLDRAIGAVRADLTAVICRLRLPLSELAAMEPGDTLPVTREQLVSTSLMTINGQKVATGRLGQVGGLRAIRINETHQAIGPADAEEAHGFSAPEIPQRVDDRVTLHAQNSLPDAPPAETPDPKLPAVTADDESDAEIDQMTPEQAAAEISSLAGLSLADMEAEPVSAPEEVT